MWALGWTDGGRILMVLPASATKVASFATYGYRSNDHRVGPNPHGARARLRTTRLAHRRPLTLALTLALALILALTLTKASGNKRRGGGGLKKKTVAKSFAESLSALMEKLRGTEHHYIRCLKPNQARYRR